MLKKSFVFRRSTGSRNLHKHTLRDVYTSLSTVTVMRGWNWLLARMGETRKVYEILAGEILLAGTREV